MNLSQAQKLLRLLGYPVNVDGQFTLQTQQAFMDLQRKHGLSQSGTLDLWTEAKLIELSRNAVPYLGKPATGAEIVASPASNDLLKGMLYGAVGVGAVGGLAVYLMRRSCKATASLAQMSHKACGCSMLDEDPSVYVDYAMVEE